MNTLKIQIGGMNKEKYLTAFKKADIHRISSLESDMEKIKKFLII